MADEIWYRARRKPGPRSNADLGVPTFKTSVRILGQDQIDTWRAMCLLAGRRPFQMAADVVLAAIREGQHDHEVQALVQSLRAFQRSNGKGSSRRLRLVREEDVG